MIVRFALKILLMTLKMIFTTLDIIYLRSHFLTHGTNRLSSTLDASKWKSRAIVFELFKSNGRFCVVWD